MTDLQNELIGENMVLSKQGRTIWRSRAGWVQTEQLKDHTTNKGRGGELGSETATCSNNFDKRMFSAVTIDYFDTIYRTRSCM
jgi:hypothetical protein